MCSAFVFKLVIRANYWQINDLYVGESVCSSLLTLDSQALPRVRLGPEGPVKHEGGGAQNLKDLKDFNPFGAAAQTGLLPYKLDPI